MNNAEQLINFIDASPTAFHATHNAGELLHRAGFRPLFSDRDDAPLNRLASLTDEHYEPGAWYVERHGSLMAWVDVAPGTPSDPLRMIGAHTDSPDLRIRPRPDRIIADLQQVVVETYGSPLLNSWLDRDLGVAGRVSVQSGEDIRTELIYADRPVMRIPQLAIHLDREISTTGLVLNKQNHIHPVWRSTNGDIYAEFNAWLASELGVDPTLILAWDLSLVDTQGGAILGADDEFIVSPRLDNLASSFGAVKAIIAARWASKSPTAIMLYNHEEVGSETAVGAASSWFWELLQARCEALGGTKADFLASMAQSQLLSADMAHATHPNYPERHEPQHWVHMGQGPVIKHNVNERYATDGPGAALFRHVCQRVGVEVQDYSHRGDLPCGSTIGPIAAARYGIRTVDVGMAQLSMHSIREMMAAADVGSMITAFSAWLGAEQDTLLVEEKDFPDDLEPA